MLEDTEWSTHRVEDGVEIALPAAWFVSRDHFGVALIAVDPREDAGSFRPNLNVAIRSAPSNESLADVAAEELAAAGDVLTDLSVDTIEPATVAEHPGIRTSATYRSGRAAVRLEQWTAPSGGAIVTVSCSAAEEEWDGYRPVFERCVQSLKLP